MREGWFDRDAELGGGDLFQKRSANVRKGRCEENERKQAHKERAQQYSLVHRDADDGSYGDIARSFRHQDLGQVTLL